VSLLLGGEHSDVDHGDSDDPFLVISYLSNFLFEFEHPLRKKWGNKQLLYLITATIAVLALCHSSSPPSFLSLDKIFSSLRKMLEELQLSAKGVISLTSR
jgi:hypothetical protein